MTELLFNSWWLPALIVLAGVVVFIAGNKRTESRTRFAGIAIAAVGVLLFAGSFLYETPNRKVSRLSRELVKSVADQDWKKTESLLDPNVTLSVQAAGVKYTSRDMLLAGAKIGTQKFGVHGASASVEDVQTQGQMLTTTLKVFVDADYSGGHPAPSDWQLDWEKDEAGNWTVRDIRCVQIGNTKGGDASQFIPQVK